jgi:two-component system sensor histidine kinase QseC
MPSGYATESMGEHQWRVFILDEPDNQVRLITAERLDIRGELVDNITWTILIIDLAGMLVLAAWIGLSIRIGLTPLQKMAHTLAQRHPQHLDRLEFGRLPAELIPMGAAINDLLHQLQELLAREKRFLADASHELRTPLAVIRLHAQNAANLPPGPERERALQLLYSGLDRTTHLISQLLTLARLEPEVDAPATLRLDLLSETRQVLAELDTLAQDHQVELVLSANEQDDWEIHLEAGALSTLLNNLVSNAIRHAPAQTQVEIDLQSNPTALRMLVIDHGCGIPDAQRSHLGERFFHVGPHAGAGLGLAIVKRVMARHGGDVCFQTTSGGGMTVQVDLPRGFSDSN